MKTQLVFVSTILFLLIIYSCRKDMDITIIEQYTISSINGFVSNEENEAIKQAQVIINGKTYITDEFGYFNIKNINHNGKILLSVKKTGYFDGSRTIITKSNEKSFTQIRLIKENYPFKLIASAGGIIELTDKVKLEFPPNAIVDKNGKNHDDIVLIGIKYLDPTLQTTFDEMPGTLIAKDQNGNDVILESYGMIGVWLVDLNGNSLNIKSGEKCKMKSKIPNVMLGYAPNLMPLWHFDEKEGIWIEEGVATKDGVYYEAEISHFSYWNYDYPRPLVNIKGKLVLNNMSPTEGIVSIAIEGQNGQRAAFTNALGEFEGIVPANEVLTLQIFDYCNTVLYNKSIGPFIDDQDLGSFVVNSGNKNINISGVVLGCDLKPSPNSIVYLLTDSYREDYTTDEFGRFTISKKNCQTSVVQIKAISNSDLKESELINLGSAIENSNIVLNACIKDLDEYIFISFSNGEKFNIIHDINGYEALAIESQWAIGKRFSLRFMEKAKVSTPIKTTIRFDNDIFSYRNIEGTNMGTTTFSTLVTDFKDRKNYSEGTFNLSGITKYRETTETQILQTDLTATGRFRYKND